MLLLAASLAPAAAAPAQPSLQILARLGDGSQLPLGTLTLAADGDHQAIDVDLDPAVFSEHFLSMRPFKCLEGPAEVVCHLPYPYAINDRISATDLADLEYRLLFIYKTPEQFHAEFFNGLYFRIRPEGGGFVSEAFEVDMNLLMTPPEAGNLRPIRSADLVPIEDNGHWLQGLEFRP